MEILLYIYIYSLEVLQNPTPFNDHSLYNSEKQAQTVTLQIEKRLSNG